VMILRFALPLLLAVATSAALALPAQAARKVPQGFIGAAMDPWELKRDGVDVNRELAIAAQSGVETIRFPIYWFDLQPYRGGSFRWESLDDFIAAAARNRLSLAPVLLGAPRWASDPRYAVPGSEVTMTIPADPNQFAEFASQVVGRYRAGGPFAQANPTLPPVSVRGWQVWNEPDFRRFWPQHAGEKQTVKIGSRYYSSTTFMFAPTYLKLLRPTSAAIRAADPSAKVMLGSMTNVAWESFARLYRAGGKGLGKAKLFDSVGINIFASKPSSLTAAASKVRSTLKANLDGSLPIVFTEYSWASSRGVAFVDPKMNYISLTPAAQATNLGLAFDLFTKNRIKSGIGGAYWYSWATSDKGNTSIWDYSGLRGYPTGVPRDKPALAAFKRKALAAAGCRWKAVANACSTSAPPAP